MPPPNMAGQLTGRSVHIIEAVGGLADSARAKAILNESALDKIVRMDWRSSLLCFGSERSARAAAPRKMHVSLYAY